MVRLWGRNFIASSRQLHSMPRQNRVTPFCEFEATPARGVFMGNRGILHDEQGRLGSARWRHKNWVACALSFKNRRRAIMAPGRYTELFFCDEAVALAAGHRPCAECRRPDFERYASAWQRAFGLAHPAKAREMDDELHRARVSGKRQATFSAKLADLADGTFVSFPQEPGAAWLVWCGYLRRWSHEGYREARPVVLSDEVDVLTPEPTARVLAAGYALVVHATAGA
jgi:hypothetical protein